MSEVARRTLKGVPDTCPVQYIFSNCFKSVRRTTTGMRPSTKKCVYFAASFYSGWIRTVEIFTFVSEQWILVSILLVLIYLLAITEGVKGGKLLTTHEITRLLNANEAILVDIRDKKEFEAGHIVGALHIPQSKVAERKAELEKSKDKIIIVADKIGQHASAVGKLLRQEGFDVRRIRGGMMEWKTRNLPLVAGKR